MARIGRNEPCPCGSGRKYKQCCASKTAGSTTSRMVLVLVAAVVLAGIIAVLSNRASDQPRGVWSPEHGHYHDASGREVPR
jgi:hypothetical protein